MSPTRCVSADAGIVRHIDWPGAELVFPLGQSAQLGDFHPGAYLPILHTAHALPVPLENIPSGHTPQPFGSAAPVLLPVPAGQATQPTPSPVAYVPGLHWPHSAWFLAPALFPVPAKQLVGHEVDPAVVENLPGVQG